MPEKKEKQSKPELDPTMVAVLDDINEAAYFALLTEEERQEEEKRLLEQREEIRKLRSGAKREEGLSEPERKDKEKEKAKLEVEIAEKEQEAKAKAPDQLQYNNEARRRARNEADKGILTENSGELIELFEQAMKVPDKERCAVIFGKLCGNGNENEILNKFYFPSNSEGIKEFGEEILVRKLGIGRQDMLSEMSAWSSKNEEKNHWETARIVGMKNGVWDWLDKGERDDKSGKWTWKDPENHVKSVLSTVGKKQPGEVAKKFSYLAYGGDIPLKNGEKKFKISPLGVAILLYLGEAMASFIMDPKEAKEKMPKDTINHLYQERQLLRDAGVSEIFLTRLEEAVEGAAIKKDQKEIAAQAIKDWHSREEAKPEAGEDFEAGDAGGAEVKTEDLAEKAIRAIRESRKK
jgi:hypothetical protein